MIKQNLTLLMVFCKRLISYRVIRLPLEILGSLLALFMFVCLILLARLSIGPVNLDSFIPQVEAALKMPEIGLHPSIEHLQLAWRDWERPFEIELVNVHVRKDDNPHWLTIHDVGISLKFYALLKGEVVLKKLHIYRPHILLEREEGGNFSLGFEDAPLDPHFSFKEISPFLSLKGAPSFLGRFKDLTKVAIIDAQIVLRDVHEDKIWTLPRLSLVLHRYYAGSKAIFTILSPTYKDRLSIGFIYKLDQDFLDLTADFHKFSFNTFLSRERPASSYDTFLSFLEQWATPITGTVHLSLSATSFQIIEGTGNLDFHKGFLNSSLDTLPSLPIASGNVTFSLSPHLIDVRKFSLLSGNMLLHFSGKISSPTIPLNLFNLMQPNQTVEFQGKVVDLPLDHLETFWPPSLAIPARTWLTHNVRKGLLSESIIFFTGHVEETGLKADDLHGTLVGKDAELTYLKGMPPIIGANARATFTQKGFDINVLSGNIEDLVLQEGRVLITKLDTDDEELELIAKIKGPLSDALDVLNHKPLEYASYGDIDPKAARGDLNLELRMHFPLLVDLQLKHIAIGLMGTGKNVALARKITKDFTAEFKNASLSIDLTQDRMEIKGIGDLNHLPSTSLRYTHNFISSDPYKLQIQIDTTAHFSDFRRFGLDCGEYAKGLTQAKIVYTHLAGGHGQLATNLDTTSSFLDFPPLEWKKEKGQPGEISFVLHFDNNHLTQLTDAVISSPLYFLKGSALFNPHNQWEKIHLSQLKGPYTDATVTLHSLHDNVYKLLLKGKAFDIEKLRQYLEQEKEAISYPYTDVKIAAMLDQLRLGEGHTFYKVKATADLILHGEETYWQAVHLRASTDSKIDKSQNISGGEVVFDIIPGSHSMHTLTIHANDAGAFLRNLDIYGDVQGGQLSIDATRQDQQAPYIGTFKLKDFEAHKVPLLAQFAAVLSPVGIANLFSAREIISMERFDCNFSFDDSLVILQKGIGKSISLGFTVDGYLDRKNDSFSLKGNIIPARFFNTFLGNIPLVGNFLSGGEGEGLFGLAYTVTGPFAAPNVSVNPLSMLTPGFLRKIFTSLQDAK